MVRRTKEEAQETRNRLLDTAERVFLAKGVSHTSLDDIAEAAGLTRGAIYWHFKNKADLFDAMMQRVCLPMEDMLEHGDGAEPDNPLESVRRCALTVLGRLTDDPQSQRVYEICCFKLEYVDEMEQVRERHIECRTECLAQIERGLRSAKKKGLLASDVNPRLAAVGLHALVDGLILNWVLDAKYLPLAKAAAPLIDSYLNGLKPASATPQVSRKKKGRR